MNKIIFSLIMISQTFWLQASEKPTQQIIPTPEIVKKYKALLEKYKAPIVKTERFRCQQFNIAYEEHRQEEYPRYSYADQMQHKNALLKMISEYPYLCDATDTSLRRFKEKCINNTVDRDKYYGDNRKKSDNVHRPFLDMLWDLDPSNPNK